MRRWTPILLIRLIGLLLCSVSVLLTLLHPVTSSAAQGTLLGAMLPGLSLTLVSALSFVSPLLIGVMLWICTRARPSAEISAAGATLLAVQTLLALAIAPELQFIVAVEAGLLLEPRQGAAWVIAQAAISWIGAAAYPNLMSWLLPAGGDPFRRTIGIGLFMLIALLYNLFAFGLGWLSATERRQSLALAVANQELQAAQVKASESARANERLAIARELHDAVGHQLSALSVHLQVATHLSRDAAREEVTLAYELTTQLLRDVRKVVTEIREPAHIDVAQVLRSLVLNISDPAIHLTLVDVPQAEDAAISHVILRCAQEIVTNAIRHAKASNLWIEGCIRSGHYELLASDDGWGAASLKVGNGLKGMRERVEELRGRMDIQTKPASGFRVSILIPLAGSAI